MKVTTLLLAGAFGVAMPLFAQDRSQGQQQPQNPESQLSQQGQKAERSQQQLKVSDQELKQQVTDANKASKLMGMKVKNKQDEDLGKISDLVVDFQSGRIAYAVMTSGATLGFGGKMVAIPVQALTLQQGEKALLVDLPKQQLAQAPGFTQNNWPDLDAAQKGQTIGLAAPQHNEAAGGTGPQSQQDSSAQQNPQPRDEPELDKSQK